MEERRFTVNYAKSENNINKLNYVFLCVKLQEKTIKRTKIMPFVNCFYGKGINRAQ